MEIDESKIYTEVCKRIKSKDWEKFTKVIFDFLANKKLIEEFVDYWESKEIKD